MRAGAVSYGEGRLWAPPSGGVVWRIEVRVPPEEAGAGAPPGTGGGRLEGWRRRMRLVRGIGPVRERRLREAGFGDLIALQRHPVLADAARRAWEWVVQRRVDELRGRRVRDGELLSLFDGRELLFFDVETLGLAPVFPVFLAGFARWDGQEWGCTMLLARTPAEEGVLLAGMEAILAWGRALVTYNGRGFDVPFVRMRRAVNGLDGSAAWPGVPVLDLLGEARRHFRGVAGDARLESVDRYLSWGRRPATIPSSLVPEYYRRFVETGDPAWIEPVLQHNLCDLLAMVRLWSAVAARTVPEAV